MKLVENIKLRTIYSQKKETIKDDYESQIKKITETYNEAQNCNHSIVVKFYGSNKSHCAEKPLYICLGCEEDLSDKADELEKDSNVSIIDFSDQFWFDVSGKKEDSYSLISYLQATAIASEYSLKYTDSEFAEEINKSKAKIMSENNFKPF